MIRGRVSAHGLAVVAAAGCAARGPDPAPQLAAAPVCFAGPVDALWGPPGRAADSSWIVLYPAGAPIITPGYPNRWRRWWYGRSVDPARRRASENVQWRRGRGDSLEVSLGADHWYLLTVRVTADSVLGRGQNVRPPRDRGAGEAERWVVRARRAPCDSVPPARLMDPYTP